MEGKRKRRLVAPQLPDVLVMIGAGAGLPGSIAGPVAMVDALVATLATGRAGQAFEPSEGLLAALTRLNRLQEPSKPKRLLSLPSRLVA